MSIFTGKECCVYSEFYVFNRDEVINFDKYKIERILGKNEKEELHFTCERDIVPYYAHMINVSCCSKDHNYMLISKYPNYVYEKRDYIKWKYSSVKKTFRRCKRENIEFTFDEVLKDNKWWVKSEDDENLFREIYNRVKEHPYAKEDYNITVKYQQFYMDKLTEAMLEAGYTEEETSAWVNDGVRLWK